MNGGPSAEADLIAVYGEELIQQLREWTDMPVVDQLFHLDTFLASNDVISSDLSW